jgi:hypothetical protein
VRRVVRTSARLGAAQTADHPVERLEHGPELVGPPRAELHAEVPAPDALRRDAQQLDRPRERPADEQRERERESRAGEHGERDQLRGIAPADGGRARLERHGCAEDVAVGQRAVRDRILPGAERRRARVEQLLAGRQRPVLRIRDPAFVQPDLHELFDRRLDQRTLVELQQVRADAADEQVHLALHLEVEAGGVLRDALGQHLGGALRGPGDRAIRKRSANGDGQREEAEQRQRHARTERDEEALPLRPGRAPALPEHASDPPQQEKDGHVEREQQRAARREQHARVALDAVVRVEERVRIGEQHIALPAAAGAHPVETLPRPDRIARTQRHERQGLRLRRLLRIEERSEGRREADLAQRRHDRGHDRAAAERHRRGVVRVHLIEPAYRGGLRRARGGQEVVRQRGAHGADADAQLLLGQPAAGPERQPDRIAFLREAALRPRAVQHLRGIRPPRVDRIRDLREAVEQELQVGIDASAEALELPLCDDHAGLDPPGPRERQRGGSCRAPQPSSTRAARGATPTSARAPNRRGQSAAPTRPRDRAAAADRPAPR